MTLRAGSRLGSYEILSPIGAGGQGEVYRARDPRLQREVAIKVLAEDILKSPESLSRFEQEARALAALNDPNILTVFDVGEVEGRPYLVTELLDGETLRERMSGERISPERAVGWGLQLARGLSTAHEKGIVHRDLKPENLFVTREGQIKILDFGLAKRAVDPAPETFSSQSPTNARVTSPGTLLGTVSYMSPEQVRGREADARSDIFSLGSVLYEALTGVRAFEADSAVETQSAILEKEPKKLEEFALELPSALTRIVERCLEKRPDDRFPSARELGFALEAASNRKSEADTAEVRRLKGAWPSIAVLPFVNMSRDPEDEYFSDGITEEIINALTQVEELRVAARTSAFKFKGKSEDLREVGEKLGVTRVLEGSVRRDGKRLRITAQLVSVEDGYHLWSERFDREMDDVFAIQDEIARAIADRMKGSDSARRDTRLVKTPTRNLEAHDLYLKGRFYWEQRGEGLRKGLAFFEKAVSLDPSYAAALVGAADTYCLLAFYSLMRPKEAMPQAKAAATRALEIEPSLAGAENALGFVAAFYDWDWSRAEEHFGRAVDLDPFHVPALSWKAFYMACVPGEFEEALEHLEQARKLDPLNLNSQLIRSVVLIMAGRFEECKRALRELAEKEPTSFLLHRHLGVSCLFSSEPMEAIRELETAAALSHRHPWTVGDLGQAYAAAGRTKEAEALLEELLDRSRREYVAPGFLAAAAAAVGRTDEAFDFLEQAYSERDSSLLGLKFWPSFGKDGVLFRDSRFSELLQKIGFPE